mgnify:CR=1 FL=1
MEEWKNWKPCYDCGGMKNYKGLMWSPCDCDSHKNNFNSVMRSLININETLFDIDPDLWDLNKNITDEEIDDLYNSTTHENYEDWGNKSQNILINIKLFRDYGHKEYKI